VVGGAGFCSRSAAGRSRRGEGVAPSATKQLPDLGSAEASALRGSELGVGDVLVAATKQDGEYDERSDLVAGHRARRPDTPLPR
jgi:hypothetical protein